MSSSTSDTRQRILAETWRLMEQSRGKGVSMTDIARAVGISRQAVYLHFGSRPELLAAAIRFAGDESGLEDKLAGLHSAAGGVQTLRAFVELWGNTIPETYGLTQALLAARETDDAAAAAWSEHMNILRRGSRDVIQALEREKLLAPGWNPAEAAEMLASMLSISIWENLTIERGWTQTKYITHMQAVVQKTFIQGG
jgi:AcrR family transcriptional regulator